MSLPFCVPHLTQQLGVKFTQNKMYTMFHYFAVRIQSVASWFKTTRNQSEIRINPSEQNIYKKLLEKNHGKKMPNLNACASSDFSSCVVICYISSFGQLCITACIRVVGVGTILCFNKFNICPFVNILFCFVLFDKNHLYKISSSFRTGWNIFSTVFYFKCIRCYRRRIVLLIFFCFLYSRDTKYNFLF